MSSFLASSWLLDRARAESWLPADSCDHQSSSSKAIHAIFCINSIALSLHLDLCQPLDLHLQTSTLSPTHHSHHGASQSPAPHPPKQRIQLTTLCSSPSPSASSPPQATPPKPPAHPPHPQPPASTTPCAPTNPSTHPTTPRPLSLPSPPRTHWKLASPTGALPKMHSR
jgi:hypothetical protein